MNPDEYTHEKKLIERLMLEHGFEEESNEIDDDLKSQICELDLLQNMFQETTLPENTRLHKFASVTSQVKDKNVLIATHLNQQTPAVNLNCAVFNESRKYIGTIVDIFGTVSQPLYCILCMDMQSISEHLYIATDGEMAGDFVDVDQIRKKAAPSDMDYDRSNINVNSSNDDEGSFDDSVNVRKRKNN